MKIDFPDCLALLAFAGLIFGGSERASLLAFGCATALNVAIFITKRKP